MSIAPILKSWFSALASVASWAWPIKFFVGAVLSVIAGGGVLTVLLENATHIYALAYGFRPPVEGLPYLRTLVSSGSAVLLILAATFAALILGFLGGMARKMAKPNGDSTINFSTFKLWKSILLALLLALLVAGLVLLGARNRGPEGPFCSWPLIPCDDIQPALSLGYLAFSLGIAFPMMFMLFRPNFAWVATSGAIAAYYVWVGSNILPPEGYARLLRSTGFGGGIHVAVVVGASDSSCDPKTFAANLLLRTNDTVILFEPGAARIHEFPVRCVAQMSYGSGGLSSLEYKLPPRNQLIERQKLGA
jgi:hypothetical protein